MTPAVAHAYARAARHQVETALDHAGWPWRRSLSLWVDALLVLDDEARSQ